MPKHIPWYQIWSTALFSLVIECFSDMILDFKLDLFGYIAPGNQWTGYLPIFIYSPCNAIFLNFFPYKRKTSYHIFYILFWTVFCLAFEMVALKSGFFYYHKWKLWYSALCYPVLLLMVLGNYKLTKKLHEQGY